MTIFLSLIASPIASRSPGPDEQVSKVRASASTRFERLEGRLVALHLLEDALLRRIAPAGVAPDLGLGAQPLDGVVEDLHELVDVELAEGLAARGHHVDLRLLHLDDRAAGVGELVSSSLSASAERPGALDRVLVVVVGDRGCQQLRQDGAELDRLPRQALRHLPHRRVLQVPRPTGPTILGSTRASRKSCRMWPRGWRGGADIVDGGLGAGEAGHVRQRIALPAHAADFFVVMRVAVGADIEPGGLLRAQMHGDRVLVLLAVARMHHRLDEALGAQHACTRTGAAASR